MVYLVLIKLTCMWIILFRYLLTHSLTHLCSLVLSHLLTYLLTHSYLLAYSLTYSLTYLLTQVGLLSLKRRGIVPSSDNNIVFHLSKWLKELMMKWSLITDYLERNQFQQNINEQVFYTCLKVVGVMISPVDVHQVWIHVLTKLNYINRVNSNSVSSIGVTLEELQQGLSHDIPGNSLTLMLTHLLTHLLTHSLTHSLTYLLTHFTHLLTHSLTH